MTEREERVEATQKRFGEILDQVVVQLNNLELAAGIDQNSWLFAGCRQDVEKAQARINRYIERCLK